MTPGARWLGIAGLATAATLLTALAPLALRRTDAFRVRTVEVRGAHHLEPRDVLETSGITSRSSVFDDPALWRDTLLTHPLIADARLARRPPSTVVIRITESQPAALVRTPELRPVDARGRILPITRGRAELDVPVLAPGTEIENGAVQDAASLAVLEALARLRTWQPELWSWVSEAHAGRRGDLRLVLRSPTDTELRFALPLEEARLMEVRDVIADLAPTATLQDVRQALRDVARIDARFHDQIVVGMRSGAQRRGNPGGKSR